MKIKLSKLQEMVNEGLISEDFMRGVPEFALKQCTSDFVEELRKKIKMFVQMRVESPTQQREVFALANSTLEELEDEVNNVMEDKLFQFMQQV